LDLLHCDPPSLVPTDYSPSTLPAGELRPRIKCGALKLSRDRATQTDTNLLCFAGLGNLDCENRSLLPRALWSGGLGFAAQGPGCALAPVHLVAPSLCPENPGPGLCFLPRNFPGWPWNPAYPAAGRCVRVVPVPPLLLCTRPARARLLIGGQSPTPAPRQLPWAHQRQSKRLSQLGLPRLMPRGVERPWAYTGRQMSSETRA
jgi:hypothetical protein